MVAVLVYAIGFDAVEESTRDEHRGSLPFQRAADPRPALPLAGGLVEDGQGWLLGDAIVTLTSLDGRRPTITAVSDSSGWWSTEVEPGRYRLDVFLADYLPVSEAIQLPASEKLVTRLVRGGTAVRGSVVDAMGIPLDKARVVIHDDARVAGVAFSRRDGSFTATVAGSFTKISAHAEGHLDGKVERGSEAIVLRLVPGVSLQGVVTNAYDQACPEADVSLRFSHDDIYWRELKVRTDVYGRFELLAPLGKVELTASGPGCSSAIPLHLELTGPRSVQILADAGHQLSGRVVVQGAPVRGATIEIRDGLWSLDTVTDEAGMFMLQGVPAVTLTLVVKHREHLQEAQRELAITGDRDLQIELDPGRPIRGRVEPPGIARLSIDGEHELLVGTSAPDGSFTLFGAPAGELSLTARTQDGLEGTTTIDTDRSNVRIALVSDNAVLEGRLVDEVGAPIAGVTLEGAQPYRDHRATTTDDDGCFRFDQLAAENLVVYVGYREAGHAVLVAGETTRSTFVVPRRHAVIRGRVVEGTTPVAGIWVSATPTNGFDLPVQALTRDDGSFEIAGVRAVAHQVSLARDGELTGTVVAEPNERVMLSVTRRPSLVVRATRAGKPVRQYSLTCHVADGIGLMTSVSSADGSHRSFALPSGPVTCFGEADGLGAVAVGSSELELAFEPLTIATGVVSPDRRVVYRYGPEAQVAGDDAPSSLADLDADGRFELKIYPGPGMVTVRDEAFEILSTRSVTGTRGGRIDLGRLLPE